MTFAEPAHPPSAKAPLVWALGAAIPWAFAVLAQIVWFVLDGRLPWLHALAAVATLLGIVLFVVVVPMWRYRVHRWDLDPTAAYTRSGWLVQERRIAPIPLPRDQAVAIGLFLNEALTNAAKYAFGDGRDGELTIVLEGSASDWRLDVRDNGAGDAAASDSDGGLGRSLMRTFAQQAGAEQDIEVNEQGCRVPLTRLPLNTQRA